MDGGKDRPVYNCTAYRTEMILLSLKCRLHRDDLDSQEKSDILETIRRLEAEMGLA